MGHFIHPSVVLMLLLGSITSSQSLSSSEINRKLENYDNAQPPYSDKATEVKVGLYALSMHIDDGKMEIEMSFYFRQAWYDPRLNFGKSVRLPDARRIWKPDTFCRSDVKNALQSVPPELQLLKVNDTGHVWFIQKVTTNFACPLAFNKYPADRQTCNLNIESFGYTASTLFYSPLGDRALAVADDLKIPQYSLVDFNHADCSANYTSGSYPCLQFQLMFKRDTGFFMKTIYVPTSAIVLLSTSAFWLPADHSGRIPVALLTTLTMTVYASVNRGLYPPAQVSDVTLLDVWLGGCALIVFAAFIVQLVGVITAKKQDASAGEKSARERLFGSKIDLVGKILFPAVFLLFIIIYACL